MTNLETLARQGRTHIPSSLAGIDTAKLKQLRNEQLRLCFAQMQEQRYRLEFVARVRGMEFFNDASSRSVNASWYALNSIEGRIIWIVNADDARADYRKLVPVAKSKAEMIICVGFDTNRLHEAFENTVPTIVDSTSINEAVHMAYCSNIENVKVVFSPAGENGVSYETEGELFTREVNEL